MFSQKCHFIFPRFSCGEFCKLCNFRFCGFVVTKAWKLHFYLCCDAEASSSILQNPVLQTMQKNGLSSSYSSLCEKIGEIVLWIKQQWCCAYYVMRCLVVWATDARRLSVWFCCRCCGVACARGVAQFAAAWHGLAVNWREEDQQLRVASSKSYKKTWF